MRLALHTVSYAGVWPGQVRLPLEPILDRAVRFGYQGIMLVAKRPHASLLDLDPGARRALRAALEARGLTLAALAGYTDFCAGHDRPEVPLREMQVLYVAELARLAHDLGGSLVRIFTGYARPGVSYDTQWGWCVEAIRECARRAADFGVTIGVQNHHDLAVHEASLRDFLREVDQPNARACFDAWSPALQGTNGDELRAVARTMAPCTAHTTVADYVRRPRFAYQPGLVNYHPEPDIVRAVPMGEGFIDYPAFLAGLREGGYPDDGWVAYELCSPLQGGGSEANLDRCAQRFVTWMREHGFASHAS
ncbi:MAG TPA: sugar phosphate isomerase/epimerase family protein [Chloroflexota bacterium]|jgi:sugar phosphate isomerase/epimerase|nr:sugar phosphate isomerase/epimerase family protein [Chloroflexota bacterium]